MNKQIPAWALYLTIAIAVVLLCGVSGAVAASKPEPEVRTVTEYKTKEVKTPAKTVTKEVEVLSNTCRNALLLSAQNMADFNSLVGSIGDAIVEFTETYNSSQFETVLAEQQVVIDDMLAAISQVVACDPTVGSEVSIGQ